MKLKDKIPIHEASVSHVQNYITWKLAVKAAKTGRSINYLLYDQLKEEQEKWKSILNRVLCVILFLAERGLAFRGDEEKIGDPTNGNFLGFIKLLSKFDPVLGEHVKNIKASQENPGTRLQVHYLSKTTQNELIEMAGKFVLDKIIKDITKAKYFAIAVDGTPDVSHNEQLPFVIRYLLHTDLQNSKFSIEERFIYFQNFSSKTGEEIAKKILNVLENLT